MKECKEMGRSCIKKEWNRFQVSLGYFTLKMHPLNSESSVTFYQPAQSAILKVLDLQWYRSDKLKFRTAV